MFRPDDLYAKAVAHRKAQGATLLTDEQATDFLITSEEVSAILNALPIPDEDCRSKILEAWRSDGSLRDILNLFHDLCWRQYCGVLHGLIARLMAVPPRTGRLVSETDHQTNQRYIERAEQLSSRSNAWKNLPDEEWVDSLFVPLWFTPIVLEDIIAVCQQATTESEQQLSGRAARWGEVAHWLLDAVEATVKNPPPNMTPLDAAKLAHINADAIWSAYTQVDVALHPTREDQRIFALRTLMARVYHDISTSPSHGKPVPWLVRLKGDPQTIITAVFEELSNGTEVVDVKRALESLRPYIEVIRPLTNRVTKQLRPDYDQKEVSLEFIAYISEEATTTDPTQILTDLAMGADLTTEQWELWNFVMDDREGFRGHGGLRAFAKKKGVPPDRIYKRWQRLIAKLKKQVEKKKKRD